MATKIMTISEWAESCKFENTDLQKRYIEKLDYTKKEKAFIAGVKGGYVLKKFIAEIEKNDN